MKLLQYLMLFFCVCYHSYNEARTIELSNDQGVYEVNSLGAFFFDYEREISSLSQLQALQHVLKPYTAQKPNVKGYWKWAKLTLKNNTQQPKWYVSFGFARLPILEMYWGETRQTILKLDESSNFSDRPIIHPQMYVPLEIGIGETKTLYIKYQTFANAPANIRLYNQDRFIQASQNSLINNAAIAGVVIAILLIVLVNLYFNPNWTNALYAIWTSLFFLIVIDMAGLTFQYLWPDSGDVSNNFSILLMAIVPIFHLLFVRRFLHLQLFHVRLDSIYKGCIALYICLVPVALTIGSVFYNLLASSLIIPIFLYTCRWSLQQKAPGIGVFSISLFNHVLFVNVLTIVGASFGDAFGFFDIATYIKIGYLIEVCLFTVAMAIQHKSVQRQLVFHLQSQVDSLNQSVIEGQNYTKVQSEQIKKNEQRLFTDLSHELRTPLTVMKIQVESLEHNIVENVQDSYKKLHEKIDELNEFINGLMQVSDAADIGKNLKISETQLKPYINEVYHQCLQLIDLKKQKLNLNCQLYDVDAINIDTQAMTKVIKEIVSNSLKYAGSCVEIAMSFIENEENLVIRIEDNGKPLTYDAHQMLFEPLYREEPSRVRNGNAKGMGLAICKKIISAHGGHMTSHNGLLGGLCIDIVMPKTKSLEYA